MQSSGQRGRNSSRLTPARSPYWAVRPEVTLRSRRGTASSLAPMYWLRFMVTAILSATGTANRAPIGAIREPEEQVREQVSGPAIANSRDRKGDGGAFYQFCRQRGLWPNEVSGWDPHKQSKKFDPYMPVRNVAGQYPPTLLIHGTEDTDVPFEQSAMMAEQFKKFRIDHELIAIAGGEHGFGGGDPDKIEQAYERAFQFVHQRMADE